MERIRITPEQYENLCDFVRNSFEQNEEKKLQFLHLDGYAENDFFFDAKGQYHAFNTCNTWINKGLKKSNPDFKSGSVVTMWGLEGALEEWDDCEE